MRRAVLCHPGAYPDFLLRGHRQGCVCGFGKVVHRRSRPAGYETGHFLSSADATNPRVPYPPGFPVRLGGVHELHAAFLIESRTRCHGWGRAVGNPGSFALFAKGGIPRISIPTVAYPTLCQERKGWGTRLFLVLPAVSNTNRGLIENLFLIKKPHEACQRHQSRQEIRGSAAEDIQFQSFAQPLLSGIYSANFQHRTLAVPHAEPSRPRRSPPDVSR